MYNWIVKGTTYSLDDGTNFHMDGISGTGMMPVRRLEERGALQNGVTDRGYRLDPRLIIMSLYIKGASYSDVYTKRAALLNMFKPRDTEGILRFELDSTIREIKGHYVGDILGMDDTAATGFTKPVVVAIKCPDPTWYDPTLITINFAISLSGDLGEIPMTVPMLVGASVLNTTQVITYQGSYETYPIVRIIGPVTDAVITHQQTGYKLDFDGVTIGAGEWIEVDTRYGQKSVIDNTGANRISALTKDSDLSLFSIVPSPEVFGGINTINVTGESVSGATSVLVSYYRRYIGV